MRLADWAEGITPEIKGAVPSPEEMPTLTMPIRDSPDTARGYREVGMLYTCIPDPVYPWDPARVRGIRMFMPDVVPMWVQWVFLEPNTHKKVVFGRHALGRAIRGPGRELLPFRCAMPYMPCQGLTFERPNRIWFIHEGERNRDYPDIPGTFLPFDDGIVHRARESCAYMNLSDKDYKERMRQEFLQGPEVLRERRREILAEDMEVRSRDWHRYADKIMQGMSDVEIEEYNRSRGKRDRVKKAMVHLSGDYPHQGD